MKYLCLGYHDEAIWSAMPDAQRSDLVAENQRYLDLLQKQGRMLDGTALQAVKNAATLRFDNGRVSVTDGPFAETKEQLGGVMLLEADDLNHAIALTSKLPCMRVGGSLEIRPINEAIRDF